MLKHIVFVIFLLMVIGYHPSIAAAQSAAGKADDELKEEQQVTNDEGYSKDDTEYYRSEGNGEADMKEGPDTSDDEAVKDEPAQASETEDNAADMPADSGK